MLFKRIQENFAVHKNIHSFYYKEFNDSEKLIKLLWKGDIKVLN